MKKKGFTLVELLAVIAILAILVIVAMPNVLGMFGEAKTNTFVTEVQKYMDTAKTAFVQLALNAPAQNLIFTNDPDVTPADNVGELDMDGSKSYYIEMDRHGNFLDVVIWDDSLCYAKSLTGTTSMDKNDVKASDVKDSSTEDKDGVITWKKRGETGRKIGCGVN